MALFGRRTAIIPLGVSCQTAHQIERAAPHIAEETGEIFTPESTPFDWRIVGVAGLGAMLLENNPYPASADELVGTKRPYWAKHRCHFWHDGAGNFAEFTAKQAHLWNNWRWIGCYERKVFVLSNTQNNLAEKSRTVGGFDYLIDPLELVMLASILAGLFERPELHVVTRKDLVTDLAQLAPVARGLKGVRLGVHLIETDASSWHGDDRLWDGALSAIIRSDGR